MALFDENTTIEPAAPRERRSRRTVAGVWALAVALVVLLVITFLPTSYVIQRPGPVYNTLGTAEDADGEEVPLISVEGAETYRGGDALKTGLFHRTWVDGNAREQELHPVTWFAAGTNVALSHEVSSLVLPVRCRATEEEDGKPLWSPPREFERSILRARHELLAAAITMLQAYLLAGKPSQAIGSFTRFETWAELVCGALVWAGGRNPLTTRETLIDYTDDQRLELRPTMSS